MASSSSSSSSSEDSDSIVIEITDSSDGTDEILISGDGIQALDSVSSVASHRRTLRVQANRTRLIEESSYFHGMLNSSFSESGLGRVAIEWDVKVFVEILKCIDGCSVDIDSESFVPLYEGAIYFGVGVLIERCKTWFFEAAWSSAPRPRIRLDDLICIWNFGFEHDNDFVSKLCASYLARNFMWACSCKSFTYIPYSLLEASVKHCHLTVESEMHLCDSLFLWLDANKENDNIDILRQIHPRILPLWYTAAKRSYIENLADKSIASVFSLLSCQPVGLISLLDECDLNDFRVRLTEYSMKVNLSSCPHVTSSMLFLSVLPLRHSLDSLFVKDIEHRLTLLENRDRDPSLDSWEYWPLLVFEAVEELNISKCRGLNLKSSLMYLSMSFPSLKRLKASYLLNFDIKTFRLLVYNFPMIHEVDFSLDMSPLIAERDSNNYLTFDYTPFDFLPIRIFKPMVSIVTQLILEGRSELCDSDLLYISKLCIHLQHLNIRGCTALTDASISTIIGRNVRLQSILACHTSFGLDSVQSLSSLSQGFCYSPGQFLECMAFNLRILHVGGCKHIDETSLVTLLSQIRMVKSLCLRDTHVTDRALYGLASSSLEMLDVCNTMVSGTAIAHVVYKNPGLKCLRVKGCKALCQGESNATTKESSHSDHGRELEIALGKACRLEEISMGWGFSYLSMEALKPAITSLKEITVGLGGSLGETALIRLPITCPNLESIVVHFQVLSDSVIVSITETLRNLRVLALCYCFGDISISGFMFSMPKLRKLELERVTPWMTNNDLFVLTKNCPNLVDFSLIGCPNLDSDTQRIISRGWPGLLSLHLEECGELTVNGVSSLFDCVALEDLLLRHNGPGIQSSFILDAASKLPLLRQVSLDSCDSRQGYFDIPSNEQAGFLRSVKLAKCRLKECGLTLQNLEPRKKPVHKETLVLEWTSKTVVRKVVKERL